MAEVAKSQMKNLRVRNKLLDEPDKKTSCGCLGGWRPTGNCRIISYQAQYQIFLIFDFVRLSYYYYYKEIYKTSLIYFNAICCTVATS